MNVDQADDLFLWGRIGASDLHARKHTAYKRMMKRRKLATFLKSLTAAPAHDTKPPVTP